MGSNNDTTKINDVNIIIIKKDGTREGFNGDKIKNAVTKSAQRMMIKVTDEEFDTIIYQVLNLIRKNNFSQIPTNNIEVPVSEMHKIMEQVLENFNPIIAKSYKDYRNYKKDFIHMMDKVYERSQTIRFIGDKDNANTDSALVATKRCLILNELNKRLYRKFFMTVEEIQACKEGYIYVHDQSARLDTINCCIFDVQKVLTGGFEMGNIWYNEPKTLDVAFDVIGDIILSAASQQYGGFTIPEIDKVLAPYAEKSYNLYYAEYLDVIEYDEPGNSEIPASINDKADKYAMKKVTREFEQGFQGIEMKLNTVGSSRGDYPFITMTFGLATDKFGKLASITFLRVHKNGQGKEGHKKPVLFPKLVFLYDENLHGEGCENEDIFQEGIDCSMKTMYPDWLSLTGEGYVPSIYKKYGKVISPMGKCILAHVKHSQTNLLVGCSL